MRLKAKTVEMSGICVRGQNQSHTWDILGQAALTYRSAQGAHMVCSYLNHAAVYRQGSANHVDVGRRSGALPLRETTTCGWVGCGVVEGMRGGIPVSWAVRVNTNHTLRLSSYRLPKQHLPEKGTLKSVTSKTGLLTVAFRFRFCHFLLTFHIELSTVREKLLPHKQHQQHTYYIVIKHKVKLKNSNVRK